MAKIHFDHLAIETFQRLYGASAFLEMADKAIPQLEREERERLRRLAEEEGWDFGDYDVERQALDAKFQHWIPRFVAHAVIILLDSIVETQLFAYAERIGRAKGSKFRPQEVKGHGLEPAALYLKATAALDIKADPAWEELNHLQNLRNILVHKGGKQGDSPEDKKKLDRLLQAFPKEKLSLQENAYALRSESEIWISLSLCRDFVRTIEEFFKRLCNRAGLPDKGTWVGS